MSETAAKELINQEKQTLYELIASKKILTATGAEALSVLQTALGDAGGGGGGSITEPVDIVDGSINDDIREINTPGTYSFNNYFYLYITVLGSENGSVILAGNQGQSILKAGEYINIEQVSGRRHGNISLVIATGGKVRIIGGF